MKKLQFSIDIKASADKVWKTLWDDKTYREWTRIFSEGSHAVSDWEEGSRVLFLSSEGEGMYSTIAKKVPNEFMSFKHLGVMKDGKELPMDEETKKWTGSMENYKLSEKQGITSLEVEVDTLEEYESHFTDNFPAALNKLKELSEKSELSSSS